MAAMTRPLTSLAIVMLLVAPIVAQTRLPVRIQLRDSNSARLAIDSMTWSDAWIEVVGGDAGTPRLRASDLLIRDDRDTARILSVDSAASRFSSRLTLSFVLDNSASMFHTYDSLTVALDSMTSGLPAGVTYQAIAFDTMARTRSYRFTQRSGVFLGQTGFTDSLAAIGRFWHSFDAIRVAFTPFFDALRLAIENVDDPTRPQVLVAVTDGDDNASETSVEDLGRLARSENVRLILISLRGESLRLRWIAKIARGALYYTDDVEDLRNLLHQLGLTMSRTYHVRYQFPSLSPSSPRSH
jgi:hypothetical protein